MVIPRCKLARMDAKVRRCQATYRRPHPEEGVNIWDHMNGLRRNHPYIRHRDKLWPLDGKPLLALYLPFASYWCTANARNSTQSPETRNLHKRWGDDPATSPNHWVLRVLVIFWIHQDSSMCKTQNILVSTNRKAAREILK